MEVSRFYIELGKRISLLEIPLPFFYSSLSSFFACFAMK